MLNKVLLYFETNSFLAHGYCLTWRTDLIALHAISDLLIFASYFVIPTAIIYLFVKRPDLLPRRVAVLFSAFIFACGLTHLIGLVTLWEPIYGFEGVVKAGTAVISGATALASWMLIPTALELPSSATLSEKNAALSHSFREQRRAYEELELIKSELEQRIQERTRELQDKAEALERVNASLSQYAHFASHDLQEPLRKIVSFSELALEEGETGGADLCHYLETIKRSASRARSLVRNILHHAEMDQYQPDLQEVSLRRETERALETFELAISERRCELHIDVPEISVRTDPTLLLQILQNLIGNALKYTPADRRPVISISARAEGAMINYVIRDNGIGFDPVHKDRIFEPFARLNSGSDVSGTGMGLAIVAKAAALLGWTISVDSVATQGTSFTIGIPADFKMVEEGLVK